MNPSRFFYELTVDSFKLYFGPLFVKGVIIASLLYVPYLVLNAAVNPSPATSLKRIEEIVKQVENYRAGNTAGVQDTGSGAAPENITPPPAFFQILVALLGITATLLHTAGMIFLTEKYHSQKTFPTLREIMSKAFESFPKVVVTAFLVYLALLGWALLLLIPCLIFGVHYLFSVQAVMLRDKYGWEAVKYSKSLVKGDWWKVFLTAAGFALIFVFMEFGAKIFFMINYAICEIAGKQIKVVPNKILEIPFQDEGVGNIEAKVLVLSEEAKLTIGKPYLKDKLILKRVGNIKGVKIRVSKYHAKANYRRIMGARPKFTKVVLT